MAIATQSGRRNVVRAFMSALLHMASVIISHHIKNNLLMIYGFMKPLPYLHG